MLVLISLDLVVYSAVNIKVHLPLISHLEHIQASTFCTTFDFTMIYPELPTTYVLWGLICTKRTREFQLADLLSGWRETRTQYLWHWVTSAVQQARSLPSFQICPPVIRVSISIQAVSPYPSLTARNSPLKRSITYDTQSMIKGREWWRAKQKVNRIKASVFDW